MCRVIGPKSERASKVNRNEGEMRDGVAMCSWAVGWDHQLICIQAGSEDFLWLSRSDQQSTPV